MSGMGKRLPVTHSNALQVTQSEIDPACTPVMRFVVLRTQHEEHEQRDPVALGLGGCQCKSFVILNCIQYISSLGLVQLAGDVLRRSSILIQYTIASPSAGCLLACFIAFTSFNIGGSLSTRAAASAVAILLSRNLASSRVFLAGGGTVVGEERIVCETGERLRGRLGIGTGW